MDATEYGDHDAIGLAALIASRTVSAEEVLDATIARIEAANPELNAVIATYYDKARASLADGLPAGPLAGVPFLLKDLSAHWAGTALTNGSRFFADQVSDADSTIVERYKTAGLVILGKTNTPELGLSPATEPLFGGATRNPWDLTRSPAGSSGGAAAAVAARMVPAAHATDGGGSIRAPASACGLVGLKPTRARTPAGPFAAEGWGGFSVAHAVTRSVRDSAALLDAAHGPAPGDPYAAPAAGQPFLSEVGADPGRLRIALATRFQDGPPTHPECTAAAEAAGLLCQSLGHAVETAAPAFSMTEFACSNVVIATHIRLAIQRRATALGREPRDGELEPLTLAAAHSSEGASATDYAAAVFALQALARRIAPFFVAYDLLLTPTLAQPPLPLGALRDQSDPYAVHRSKVRDFAPFTGIFNVTGQPAISLPLGWTAGGMPIGVQFAAAVGREDVLLRLAAQVEAAAPWSGRRPAPQDRRAGEP